ncbi:MAG TPA: peptide chain release factor N(5)-glutamine methyltransferase [Anaerolineales bacterium]
MLSRVADPSKPRSAIEGPIPNTTIGAALESARRRLQHQSSSPTLDAQVLLAAALSRSRTWLLAHPELELAGDPARKFEAALEQMLAGAALPHVLGEWEFYGRRFQLSPAVLIPRPETERVVEAALELAGALDTSPSILELGTGSGCMAVSLALEIPAAKVIATDLSRGALQIARLNAQAHGVTDRIRLVQADLLGGIVGRFDIVCANLPYVRTAELGGPLSREPRLALDGGDDGLQLIRRLLRDLPGRLGPGGGALLEIDPRQAEQVVRLAQTNFPGSTSAVLPDLAGRDRVVVIRAGDSRDG